MEPIKQCPILVLPRLGCIGEEFLEPINDKGDYLVSPNVRIVFVSREVTEQEAQEVMMQAVNKLALFDLPHVDDTLCSGPDTHENCNDTTSFS